jgi:hypothetical protein
VTAVGYINQRKETHMKLNIDHNHRLHEVLDRIGRERRLWAQSRGFTITHSEVADYIADRLIEMMKEEK